MECNQEDLQLYLDGEMNASERKQLEGHLGECPGCRREIARLQLLWLQLGQHPEVSLPPEMPSIRRQIIHQTVISGTKARDYSYWSAQKLAWEPALLGVSYFPGTVLLSSLAQSTAQQIPRALSGTVNLARHLVSAYRGRRGGPG